MSEDEDEGCWVVGDGGERNSFWRCRAERVCFHPGADFPVDVIQGQKCLCCFIGSNSIAFVVVAVAAGLG